jgi:hypothetical protein
MGIAEPMAMMLFGIPEHFFDCNSREALQQSNLLGINTMRTRVADCTESRDTYGYFASQVEVPCPVFETFAEVPRPGMASSSSGIFRNPTRERGICWSPSLTRRVVIAALCFDPRADPLRAIRLTREDVSDS